MRFSAHEFSGLRAAGKADVEGGGRRETRLETGEERSFPDVKGGQHSLVFFKEIARAESKFIEEYSDSNTDSLRRDVLGRVWRNSEILVGKYRSLRRAFVCMVLGAILWSISLALFALSRTNVQVLASMSEFSKALEREVQSTVTAAWESRDGKVVTEYEDLKIANDRSCS